MKQTFHCVHCSAAFERLPNEVRQGRTKYCGPKCRTEHAIAKKKDRKCACGKPVYYSKNQKYSYRCLECDRKKQTAWRAKTAQARRDGCDSFGHTENCTYTYLTEAFKTIKAERDSLRSRVEALEKVVEAARAVIEHPDMKHLDGKPVSKEFWHPTEIELELALDALAALDKKGQG